MLAAQSFPPHHHIPLQLQIYFISRMVQDTDPFGLSAAANHTHAVGGHRTKEAWPLQWVS
jgi:hypothetical protein